MTAKKNQMRGMGRTFQRERLWWISYYVHGTEHRESARSTREGDARRLLKKRLAEIEDRRFVGPSKSV